ncbi:helix-hairpin-helix domain-containing protein [Devosia sp. J2-20]|uniref:helix-hairpin-helix domain-containing protein n=1 Tax=Devosia sp. J2-20 TaxID=3026161 RepID=UPI00249B015E|nr:helix-hairpin-helix domain-containing protein [Devosia sp. J2-20]WDR00746.1 helix-hairpin-helix domain-containing protein [Devosia sp. J2-20]
MDDLTTLKGVGRATEKKLLGAGLDSFAKLAGATPDQLSAAQVAGGPSDWVAMIAAAAEMAPTPTERQMTAEELSDLVQSWVDARAELMAASDAVVSIHYQLDTIEAGTDRSQIEADLDVAKELVKAVEGKIAALAPLPEGVVLPDASQTNEQAEIPAGSHIDGQAQSSAAAPTPGATDEGLGGTTAETAPNTAAVASAADTNTTQSDDGQEGETGNAAGLATDGLSVNQDVLDLAGLMRAALQDQLTTALDLGGDEALDMLTKARSEVTLMAALAVEFGASLDAEIAKVSTSTGERVAGTVKVTGPAAGRWRIGHYFTAEPETFAPGSLSADELTRLQADPLLTVAVSE